jgi:hypothetical protein
MKQLCRRSPAEVTPYLIDIIRSMSPTSLQSEIARATNLSPATVGKVQRREGIAHPNRTTGRALSMAKRKS